MSVGNIYTFVTMLLQAGPRMAGLKAARALAVDGSKVVRHVTKISDLTRGEVEGILDAAVTLKTRPVADFKVHRGRCVFP